MNPESYLQFVLALVFVLGLIGLAARAARRFGLAPAVRGDRSPRRLAVLESIALDAKRRLVLLRRDGVEHLVILGPSSDVVVERAIVRVTGAAAGAAALSEASHAG